MASLLWRKRGEQFRDNADKLLKGGKLYFYEAGTEVLQTTFSDAAATTPNENPMILDGYGRLQEPVYLGDSATFDAYKERLTSSSDVVIAPWPMDDIPAAVPDGGDASYAALQLQWSQVTSAQSPRTLAVSELGRAFEADTTSGNILFNLPSATECAGRGFTFKKLVAANTVTIDPNGSQTIDDVSTALAITSRYAVVSVYSNGAEWYKVDGIVTSEMLLSSFINGLTAVTGLANTDELLVQLTGAGAFRKIQGKYLPGTIIAIIEDQKTSGTAGGTFTLGADRTRTLNQTPYVRDSLVTLASNQFTLPAGDWTIEWSAPASDVGSHQTLLYNITDAAVTARGSSEFVNVSTTGQSRSWGSARVSLTVSTAFEIRHRSQGTGNTTGFGVAGSFGTEVYTRVIIRKG